MTVTLAPLLIKGLGELLLSNAQASYLNYLNRILYSLRADFYP